MKHNTKGPTQRQLRVGEQLRHIIAETMQRGHFQSGTLFEAGRITVGEVRVSPDLRNATVYVLPLGGEDMEPVLEALNEEHHTFQKEINRQSNIKFTPRVRFRKDETFDEAQRIEELLHDINKSSD